MYLLANFWNKFLVWTNKNKINLIWITTCLLFMAGCVYLSLYRFTETPPTWMDEGIIIQTARNLWLYGEVVLQNAPGVFESGWYVTTSYPVTFPIAVAFEIFGYSLGAARSIMILYLVLLVISCWCVLYIFARTYSYPERYVTTAGLALIVTFAPLYGHGKNVLGEIPGMFWLVMASMFGLLVLGSEREWLTRIFVFCSGLMLGLSIATKPIYILAAIACIVGSAAFIFYERVRTDYFDYQRFFLHAQFFVVGSMIPLVVWFLHQFNNQSVNEVLQIYANPHQNELGFSIVYNLKLFFTEVQPMHAMVFFVLWTTGIAILIIRRSRVTLVEFIAWFLSLGVLIAFLRTESFYRYFFIAQFVSLLFAAVSFVRMGICVGEVQKERLKIYALACMYVLPVMIAGIQLYYLASHSWINTYKNSTRAQDLSTWSAGLPKEAQVFLYQTPEVATFLGARNYYQYMKIMPTTILGKDALKYISKGNADFIVMPQGEADNVFTQGMNQYMFDGYVSRYEVWKLR